MNDRALASALVAACSLTLAVAMPATAQESGTFTLVQGGNQVATETFTRSGDQLETELRVTGQGIIATDAVLGTDGTVERVELRILPVGDPDADPLQSTAADFQNDSIHVEQPIGTATASSAATGGTVPYVNPSPSYMEQILRRARALGGSEVTVQIWTPGQGAGDVGPAHVAFDGESAILTLGEATIELETDAEGRVLKAEVPDQGLVIERE